MQSQGSTSSPPLLDSLGSSGSLAFSDSEQAEDYADVFLTNSSPAAAAAACGRGGVSTDGNGGSESPGSQWACDGFADKEEEEEEEEEEGCCDRSESRAVLRVGDTVSQSSTSQRDLLFAQKCAELQGFVRPLLELLNGLKRGRFERGLSSFQQSVAMDRIQRIVGVLQRPNCGEKYLNTLLQVEMMLKVWFPQIATHSAPAPSTSPPPRNVPSSTPPHKHRDQLHIPVKKRRLSWTGTDSPTPSPVLPKHPRTTEQERWETQGQDEAEAPPPGPEADPQDRQGQHSTSREQRGHSSSQQMGQCSEPSLTWVHVAPILSPPKACPSLKGTVAPLATESPLVAVAPPISRGSPATQDSSISSTTPRKQPKSQKKPLRCQSQPITIQQTESKTLGSCPRQNQAPPVTVKALSRLCPTPSET